MPRDALTLLATALTIAPLWGGAARGDRIMTSRGLPPAVTLLDAPSRIERPRVGSPSCPAGGGWAPRD